MTATQLRPASGSPSHAASDRTAGAGARAVLPGAVRNELGGAPSSPKAEATSAPSSVPSSLTIRRDLAKGAAAALLGISATMPLAAAFEPAMPAIAAAVAAAFAAACCDLASAKRSRRRPQTSASAAGMVLHLIAAVVVAGLVVARSATLFGLGVPTPASVGATLTALLDSARSVLSAPLPGPAVPPLLMTVFVLAWAGTAGAAAGARRRAAWAPLAVPAVLCWVAALAGRGNAALPLAAFAFVATGVGWAAVRRRERVVAPALAQVAIVGAVLLCAGLACAVAPALVSDVAHPGPVVSLQMPPERVVVRDPLAVATAVQRIGAGTEADREVVASQTAPAGDGPIAHSDAGAARPQWRVVALERFDGAVWRDRGDYALAGSTLLPAGAPRTSEMKAPHVGVTVRPGADAELPWLPVPLTTSRLDASAGTTLVHGADGNVLASPANVGVSYVAASGDRPAAPGGSQPARRWNGDRSPLGYDPALRPEAITQAATTLLGVGEDRARLERLATALRTSGIRNDAGATAGTGFVAADGLLARRGVPAAAATEAQFAAAFALVADAAGYRTRVVVGYGAGIPQGDTDVVHLHDLRVWPEVDFGTPAAAEWVPFAAAPTAGHAMQASAPTVEVSDGSEATAPTTAPRGQGGHTPDRAGTGPGRGGAGAGNATLHAALRGAAALIGLAALSVIAIGGAVAARVAVVRRRRRNCAAAAAAESPAVEIATAWATLADAVTVFAPGHPAATARDVATAAADGITADAAEVAALGAAARLANHAIYASAVQTSRLDGSAAAAVRGTVDAAVRRLDALAPPLRRLRWRLG